MVKKIVLTALLVLLMAFFYGTIYSEFAGVDPPPWLCVLVTAIAVLLVAGALVFLTAMVVTLLVMIWRDEI